MTKQLLYVSIFVSSLFVSASLVPLAAEAQETADEIESLFSQEEAEQQLVIEQEKSETKPADIKELSDLEKLSEFKDIAVIQRRYLPKTGRFELFGGGSFVMNSPFHNSFGFNGRFAYYFREAYGIEFVSMLLTTAERQVITDLRERTIETESLVTPKTYVGLDFKWTPVYGKMSWRNKAITPFDLYFSIGGGMTGTNQGRSEPTLHLGTGQVFALSKSVAFRWDFTWNTYSATYNSSGSSQSGLFNNLFLTVGMSWFFPEATYR